MPPDEDKTVVKDGAAVVGEAVVKGVTKEDHEKAIREASTKAREEERKKYYADLEREKSERIRLEAELSRREKESREKEIQALPQDQQLIAKLKDIETQLARERAERQQSDANYQAHLRTMSLVAYRERAVRDVPLDVSDFVAGSSEEEIDRAADRARAMYSNLESRLRQQFEQRVQASAIVAAPPQNPAYVAPPTHAGSYPTVTNPTPVATDTGADLDTRALTSEDAVRSGRYGGEMRQRLLAGLRSTGVAYTGDAGNSPRHLSVVQQMPQQVLPGGVNQPMGLPVPPARPASVAQPTVSARQAALEAINRTHAGTNPVVNGDAAARSALSAAQNHAQSQGLSDPRQVYAQRFAQDNSAG